MEQTLKIKCPHCGWARSLDVGAYEDSGEATVVRGVGDDLFQVMAKFKEWAMQSDLNDANAWVDLKCPYTECRKTYRFNVKTREVKP